MVEEHKQNIRNNNSPVFSASQLDELISWIRSLQLALTVEVEHDFIDIQGRSKNFSTFTSSYLLTFPPYIPGQDQSKLKQLACDFDQYSNMSTNLRRRTIVKTRRYLHNLRKYFEESKISDHPTLKIRQSIRSKCVDKSHLLASLSLENSIANIKGIGPKMTEKLSSLGLFLIRDLILYFPRDYVDYTSLKTIDKVVPGDNVTIIAKIKRCNAFKSPKNPNLSILELFIKDKTGGLKVTKFFAGRRTSNIAYLKSQQSLFPVGANVAVSGLV